MPGRRRDAINRRKRGAKLLLAGKSPREVGEQVGVSRQTVYMWKNALKRDGNLETFTAINRGGRPARLGPEEKEWLDQALSELPSTHQLHTKRAATHPPPNDRWTLKLVQRLIEQRLGLDLSISRISRLLHELYLSPRIASAIGRANRRRRERSRA